MFTGIVQSIGIVSAFQRRSGGARLVVETGLPEELLRIGDSIAVDGCCQTIVQAEGTVCTFDCLEETLRRSVFGEYVPGRPVNIEPALAVGDRLGGHIVQGHVDCERPVVELRERQGDRHLTIRRPPREEFPVVEKGSVAINGVSLTVAELTQESFSVCIIPQTWEHTALHALKCGSRVNLEADLIGKYVAQFLQNEPRKSSVTMESLTGAGF